MKIISAGGIVNNNRNQIILVKEWRGSWGFPKGHIEEGETELDAAKREIYEETGVKDLEYIKELGIVKHMKSGVSETKITGNVKYIKFFLFKSNQDVLIPIDPQNPEAKWFNYDEVIDNLKYSDDKEFFRNLLNNFLIK